MRQCSQWTEVQNALDPCKNKSSSRRYYMAKKPVQKPKIKIMAADWSLRDYPTARNPWSIRTKVRKVKEAGFHGMSSGADAELAAELHKQGLEMVGGVDVGSKKEADAKMKAFADIGVVHINVQLCDHDTKTKDCGKSRARSRESRKKAQSQTRNRDPSRHLYRNAGKSLCTRRCIPKKTQKEIANELRPLAPGNHQTTPPARILGAAIGAHRPLTNARTHPLSPLYGQPLSDPGNK